MTLALTSIIVLLLASPGFIARSSYYKNKFSKQAVPKSMTEDIVRGVLYAMPIHLIAIAFWEHIHHRWWIGRDIDFVAVPLAWFDVRLRRCEAAKNAQKAERKKCCLTLLHHTPIES